MRGSGDGSIQDPLGFENSPVEPSRDAETPEGQIVARTLVRHHREILVMVLNATRRYHPTTKESTWNTVSETRW